VDRADEIFVERGMSRKCRPKPIGTLTKRLPLAWKMAMNSPIGGSVRISAIAVLTHADLTIKSGAKLFRGLLTYVSFVLL
jgi:hypothetical protein